MMIMKNQSVFLSACVASFVMAILAAENTQPTMQYENEQGLLCDYYGPYGGGGGRHFYDNSFARNGTLSCVSVWWGLWIDGFQATYTSTTTPLRGRMNGAHTAQFCLEDGETIIEVSGTSGAFVDSLYFHTDEGNSYGSYGNAGPNPFVIRNDRGLTYFSGQAGYFLDNIGFHFCG